MIRKYSPIWNLRGFGPNDPGHMRDKTRLNDDHWHVRYPIDPNHRCEGIPAGLYDPLELLRLVCKEAPYWVRFQGNRSGKTEEEQQIYEEAHRDFSSSKPVSVPASSTAPTQCVASHASAQSSVDLQRSERDLSQDVDPLATSKPGSTPQVGDRRG